jgi:hypothetical protein
MKKNSVILSIVLVSLLVCLIPLQTASSASPQKIYIKPDGSITPSASTIHQIGAIYTFSGNINSQIVVECNNIVIDGSGYSVQGEGSGVGFDLTCSNVTIQNTKITDWDAGVLGVFNNNTIKNCLITQCASAFKVYAQYYEIVSNRIEGNKEAIRIGQGGLHFIAGNDITNNTIGLYLFDDGNVIVQNNITNCSNSAIILDTTAWTQTVYNNNFENNIREIIDYTYSNTPDRPVQSIVQPWDNGSSGNYWSGYQGVDSNQDGIGDSPYQIATYYTTTVLSPNSYFDRYPIMTPQNIKANLPPISSALISPPINQPRSIPDNRPDALSFLKNVVGIDLGKYQATLVSGLGTEDLHYSLSNFANHFKAQLEFSNGTLTSCYLSADFGEYILSSNPYATAEKIIQNYQTYSNDSVVGKMADLTKSIGEGRNVTLLSSNIDLKILATQGYSTFSWNLNYNGADYSGIQLSIENFNGPDKINSLTFSDTRPIFNIGNTNINIQKQQAITLAEDYVKNNFSYPQRFLNDTVRFTRGLQVVDENTTASLATTTRDPTTLYPYWNVRVALDHTYPALTVAVNVKVWADTGTIFEANTVSDGSFLPSIPSLFLAGELATFETVAIAALLFLIAIAIVLVVILRGDKKKPNKNNL